MKKVLLAGLVGLTAMAGAASAATVTLHNYAAATVDVTISDAEQPDALFKLVAGGSHTWTQDGGRVDILNGDATINFTNLHFNVPTDSDDHFSLQVYGWNEGLVKNW